MAEIKTPLTPAMKRRARAAIEAIAGVDEDGNGLAEFSKEYTPRELRAIILHTDRSPAARAAMKREGWFEATTSPTFRPASNRPGRV